MTAPQRIRSLATSPGPRAAGFIAVFVAVFVAVFIAVFIAGCAGPAADRADGSDATSQTSPASSADRALADTLTRLIEDAYDFSAADVVARMGALYPDTGAVVSASGGRIVSSADSLRAGIATFWRDVGVNMREPEWVWHDVHVERLARDAAVLTATWSIPHVAPTDQPHTISGAWTAVFRRTGDGWKIVHEHLSTPE